MVFVAHSYARFMQSSPNISHAAVRMCVLQRGLQQPPLEVVGRCLAIADDSSADIATAAHGARGGHQPERIRLPHIGADDATGSALIRSELVASDAVPAQATLAGCVKLGTWPKKSNLECVNLVRLHSFRS